MIVKNSKPFRLSNLAAETAALHHLPLCSRMVWSRKFVYLVGTLALLISLLFCGCVTEAQANARAKAAYLAGQKAAFDSIGGVGRGVTIVGAVDHPNVPWVEGLTLAQAIATANYTSHPNPKTITITPPGRGNQCRSEGFDWRHVVSLQPGDKITIQ